MWFLTQWGHRCQSSRSGFGAVLRHAATSRYNTTKRSPSNKTGSWRRAFSSGDVSVIEQLPVSLLCSFLSSGQVGDVGQEALSPPLLQIYRHKVCRGGQGLKFDLWPSFPSTDNQSSMIKWRTGKGEPRTYTMQTFCFCVQMFGTKLKGFRFQSVYGNKKWIVLKLKTSLVSFKKVRFPRPGGLSRTEAAARGYQQRMNQPQLKQQRCK